ncbi:MAG TPA: transposase [Firmicutes bacterium]|nr:transposase [Bacillota bacterium]
MFLTKLGSRRQINFKFTEKYFIKNLSLLSGRPLESMPNDGTLANLVKRLDEKSLFDFLYYLIKKLLRSKVLEKYRLNGYYLFMLDGTGYLSFNSRHCSHCLEHRINGIKYYSHHVLDCKLITYNGLALSIGSEFIENLSENETKQDCELNAFYRYCKILKDNFPQLKICLVLDGLYANRNVIDLCQKNNWKYIITFKKGSVPTLFEEFERLKKLTPDSIDEYDNNKNIQKFHWINNIDYEGRQVNVLECSELDKKTKQRKKYVWITNFQIDKNNCRNLANKGGRLRWKIENEGFNMQKNGGYALEHAYCEDITAIKNFYLLLQISHIFNQLIEKGSLLELSELKKIGSIRNIAFFLLESLRNTIFTLDEINMIKINKFQIRLDSS